MLNITNENIKNNPYLYSEEQLIYTLETYIPSLRLLNKYQKLSAHICAKYIIFGGINKDNGDCTEDTYLATGNILNKQTHLTEQDIIDAYCELKEIELMASNDYNIFV
jgi:hypothetical protein